MVNNLAPTPTWCHTHTWRPERRRKLSLRHETCQHVAVKVWWRDLQTSWECSLPCYAPIQCQTSTIVAPEWLYTPTWWPNSPWSWKKNEIFPNLRHERCQSVKIWLSWWECWSPCYTPTKCQTNTIVASLHLWGTTWWPNIAWKSAENWDLRQEICQHVAL